MSSSFSDSVSSTVTPKHPAPMSEEIVQLIRFFLQCLIFLNAKRRKQLLKRQQAEEKVQSDQLELDQPEQDTKTIDEQLKRQREDVLAIFKDDDEDIEAQQQQERKTSKSPQAVLCHRANTVACGQQHSAIVNDGKLLVFGRDMDGR